MTMLRESVNILASLNVLHNYFDDPKLFSDQYLAIFRYFSKSFRCMFLDLKTKISNFCKFYLFIMSYV